MTGEPGKRARLTAGILLLMVLGAGVALGAALDRQLRAGGTPQDFSQSADALQGSDARGRGFDSRGRDRSRPPGAPGDSVPRRPPMIVDEVGLSEVQNEQVDSIVRYFGAKMRDLHEEFDRVYSTRYGEIIEATRSGIRSVLTPEQQVMYDSLLAEREQRRRDWRSDSTGVGEEGESRER